MTLLEQLLPKYDFNEIHSIAIDVPAEIVYRALFTVDLGGSPIVRLLMGLRAIPRWLGGAPFPTARERMTLADAHRAGFTIVGEDPPREVVLGIQGTFWKSCPDIDPIDAGTFTSPVPAGVARAAWNFTIELRGPGSQLTTETRILCGDAPSRRRFGRYWTFIQPGSAIIRWALLRSIRDEALETR